ncbi:LLM class flavin-dependent oxidoreductase [Nonomuraea soli]|uniref:Alkanesulfonate monooxygenase SsuD/methylene tetrahydromethanopterin reductase-like flavin-dependent oxidoreductase (Luciferase family) n=1 Tax=Nonomuraea soli TaxID=1032476 RepID=A0A7W0HQJ2_9ACTN|nr:LLM class flavin-dependent oxidoreductase [Nonomuraea soli]MBA2891925.1 alkanesulfonate monooxygenase SsuD/methylene tetrahydromethanopterin reductase-like flavin-dependent oxidoreductase (luciferase family) [Nonomuraea soli]
MEAPEEAPRPAGGRGAAIALRLGIFLVAAGFPGVPPEHTLRTTLDTIVAAEEAGFDDVWIAEHHFMSYGVCPSPMTMAAVAAGRTRRIGLGTAVSVLSTAHPVALAEQAAMIHHLSGGRFTLGVGRGGPWVDLEVFGTGLPRFEYGFAESLDLLRACLDQPKVSASGEFFSFREVSLVPHARLRPVVACTSLDTVRLAASRGLPMLLGMHIDDEGKLELIRAHGGDGHLAAVAAHVADTTAEAVAEMKARMPAWLAPGLAGYVPVDARARSPRDVEGYIDFLTRVHPVGSAGHCAAVMRRTAEVTGLRHLLLMVEGTGDPVGTVRRLGEEVLPLVKVG